MKSFPKIGLLCGLATACAIDNGFARQGEPLEISGAAPDVNQAVPPFPFTNAIQSCLGLDTSACPINYNAREVDSDCSENASAEREALENQVVMSAREETGDNSITLNDIENGDVLPATIYAYSFLDDSEYKGEEISEKTGVMHFSFGDHSEYYSEGSVPGDNMPFGTIRCSATAYSYDLDSSFDEVPFENARAENTFVQGGEETAELKVADFTVTDEGSIMAMSNGYSADDPNFDFNTTLSALNGVAKAIFNTASALAPTDEGENAEVYVYE